MLGINQNVVDGIFSYHEAFFFLELFDYGGDKSFDILMVGGLNLLKSYDRVYLHQIGFQQKFFNLISVNLLLVPILEGILSVHYAKQLSHF